MDFPVFCFDPESVSLCERLPSEWYVVWLGGSGRQVVDCPPPPPHLVSDPAREFINQVPLLHLVLLASHLRELN